jgi:hypothetical protein
MSSRKRTNDAANEALKIRPDTKRHFERIAAENRLTLADAAEVVLEAWERMTRDQQMDVIRRPAEPVPA